MDSEAIGGTGTSKDGWKREKERKKKSWKKFLSPKISKTGFWWWPVGGCDGKPRLSSGESPAKFRKSTFSYSYCPEHPLLSYIGKRLSKKRKLKNFLSPKNWKIFLSPDDVVVTWLAGLGRIKADEKKWKWKWKFLDFRRRCLATTLSPGHWSARERSERDPSIRKEKPSHRRGVAALKWVGRACRDDSRP